MRADLGRVGRGGWREGGGEEGGGWGQDRESGEGGIGSDRGGGWWTDYPYAFSSTETVEVLRQKGGVEVSAVGTTRRRSNAHFFRVVIARRRTNAT